MAPYYVLAQMIVVKKIDYFRSHLSIMEITNEERVLQRLEQLQRRSYALQVAVKQLVAEIKVDKMKCGEVGNKKKDLLKVRVRRLFDVNTRLRNLARNHRRSKNLEENVDNHGTIDDVGIVESCGADSEFDPSAVEASTHQPRLFPVEPLPHRFAILS